MRDLPGWVWLQTPMALDLVPVVSGRRLVYDVMDDLASFGGAPGGLVLRQRRSLQEADVVFTGPDPTGARREAGRPVAGYVGVIDERIDLDLVAGLADALPDWEIRMVGPVTKIDEASLPRRANLVYPGRQPYEALPAVMGGFDVALMPFALNEATASISPTKTLAYLAAGLPVVSTRIADVVADHHTVVDLQAAAADLLAYRLRPPRLGLAGRLAPADGPLALAGPAGRRAVLQPPHGRRPRRLT